MRTRRPRSSTWATTKVRPNENWPSCGDYGKLLELDTNDLRGGKMRDSLKRFLSALFESLPTNVLLNIKNRAAIFVTERPQLLSKQSVRFMLFDVLKVELATVEIRIEEQI